MKKNIKLPVVAALAVALTTPVMAQPKFPDVVSNEWYATAIENAVNNGLLSGYSDGTMRPQKFISRAEVASIFTKAFAASEKASLKKFDDMDSKEWYYEAMSKAVNMGLFTGDNNDCLNPNDPITREEVAVVVTKAFDLEYSGKNVLARFVDKASVSDWAVPYISALVENGYMAGNAKGQLKPRENITRAEFAQVMSNITNNYITEEGTISGTYDGTVVVNVEDVVMKDATINGDLVIADGVGTGDFTLNKVTVNGNIVVRGGGANSVKILGKSKITGKVVLRNPNGKTRIHAENELDAVIEVNSPAIIDAECENVVVNSSVNVEVTGKVDTMEVNAEDVKITGKGTIKTVEANADDIKVIVKDTKVVAAEGVSGVVAGNKKVEAGTSTTVKVTGGGGGSSSSSVSTKNLTLNIKTVGSGDTAKYEVEGNNTFEGFASNIKYNVVVNLDKEEIPQTSITTAGEAYAFIQDLVLNKLDMYKLMRTMDAKKADFIKKESEESYNKKYEKVSIYMDLLQAGLKVKNPNDHDDYDDLMTVKAKLDDKEDNTVTTFEEAYTEFEKLGSKANLAKELDVVKDILMAEAEAKYEDHKTNDTATFNEFEKIINDLLN